MADEEQQKSTRWTAAQRKFMVYVATPKEERMPMNEFNYAQENGINRTTLWKWKNLPGFYAEVNKLVDEHLADDFAEVTDALKRQAKAGSFPHQKLYFEMIGKYVQKIAPTTPDGLREWLAGFGDSEIDRAIIDIVDKARQGAAFSPAGGAALPVDDASTP